MKCPLVHKRTALVVLSSYQVEKTLITQLPKNIKELGVYMVNSLTFHMEKKETDSKESFLGNPPEKWCTWRETSPPGLVLGKYLWLWNIQLTTLVSHHGPIIYRHSHFEIGIYYNILNHTYAILYFYIHSKKLPCNFTTLKLDIGAGVL